MKNNTPRLAGLVSTVSLTALTLFFLAAPPARAATIQVDTTQQCQIQCASRGTSGDGVTGCSFGEAITAIQLHQDVGDCKNSSSDPYGTSDTIELQVGETYTFSHADHIDLFGPTGLPIIYKSMTIHGNGSTLVLGIESEPPPDVVETISLVDAFPAFIKTQATTIRRRTLRFFEILSVDGRAYWNLPSQIMVEWDRTTFEGGNPGCAPSFNEDLYNYYGTGQPCYSGGAGFIKGAGAFVSFDQVSFNGNEVVLFTPFRSPLGGAVYVDGGDYSLVNFSNSLFTANRAPAGGALYSGAGAQINITDSTFADNEAVVLDIQGQPFNGLTADNRMGGAVYADGFGIDITHSAFLKNVSNIGALAIRTQSSSVLNSSFFENHADLAGGALAATAIPFNYRDLVGPSATWSDISFNYDLDSDRPIDLGTFYAFATEQFDKFDRFGKSPDVTIEHITAVQNDAGNPESQPTSDGGGLANLGTGTITLKNSIVAKNTVAEGGSGPDCYGAFVSYGHNDINWPTPDGSCALSLASGAEPDVSVDPVLKACNEDTTTAALASCDPDTASPMIEGANSCPADDQHHTARKTTACTIGAIEVAAPPPPAVVAGITCGNGQVEEGEECDNGESRNSNEPDAACRPDCTARTCGDGVVDVGAGEECEPALDPLNCRTDCTIDLCFQVKADAVRVGTGEMTLSEYLGKYAINPNTGCSANPFVNQCQPLASLGGPGSNHADFTVPNTLCETTPGDGGCSLSQGATAQTGAGALALLILPGILLGIRRSYFAMRS